MTKPSGIDRAAEPEPRRAIIDNCLVERFNSAAVVAARVRAAKPEAEEAIPAPVGKLLTEATLALVVMRASWRM